MKRLEMIAQIRSGPFTFERTATSMFETVHDVDNFDIITSGIIRLSRTEANITKSWPIQFHDVYPLAIDLPRTTKNFYIVLVKMTQMTQMGL